MAPGYAVSLLKQRKKRKNKEEERDERIRKLEEVEKLKKQLEERKPHCGSNVIAEAL